MTQTQRIAKILTTEGYVDNFRCISERISLRTGARIWELRNRGWKIRTEEKKDKNTYYYLEAKPEPKQETLI